MTIVSHGRRRAHICGGFLCLALVAAIDGRASQAGCSEGELVKKEEKSSAGCSFHYAEVLARVHNDREALHDLVTIFKEEFPRHLETFRKAVESRDRKRVAAASPTLKAMCSST